MIPYKMKSDYPWTYASVGGAVRVMITSGEDIAHLGELDQKLWTALSCPVDGLEMDSAALKCVDTDGDGTIRVTDVVDTAKWLTSCIRDNDVLLDGPNSFKLDNFYVDDPKAAALCQTAKSLVGDKEEVSLSDINYDSLKVPEPAKDPAIAVYDAVEAKIDDFFSRCALIAYGIEAEAAPANPDNLEALPLVRPSKDAVIKFNELNPVWKGRIDALRASFDIKADELTADEWNQIKAKAADLKANQPAAIQVDLTPYQDLEKFLRLVENFATLLRNFVVFSDFYDLQVPAIFEAGQLYIDRRCCKLCIRVKDMAAHANMAALSGMFLIYCHCSHKLRPQAFDIVAVMTDGDTRNIVAGKNAVFYDLDGNDWTATVTKVVDNPINVKTAFWSPYRKFWNFCLGILNKSAQDKEKKVTEDMEAAAKNVTSAATDGQKTSSQGFDIAKFAGIFAALGMGLGMLADAVMGVFKGIAALQWWQLLAYVAGVILVISGPSCFIAWTKLRKRNLGPVLNANGWAINSEVLVNETFGVKLTSTAKYPLLKTLRKNERKKNRK